MLVMAVSEANKIADTNLRIRGEPEEFGREIPRGFLTIASSAENPRLSAHDSTQGSGRVELADWIVRDGNPLTARVAVNRVWQHLFGRGIVSTVNNFGANGDRPKSQLVPGKQVAREIESYDDQQQNDADNPIGPPAFFETAGEKHPKQVQEDGDDEQVGGPVVNSPD